jgi:hypothetical protein
MTKIAKRTSLALVAICALTALAAPTLAVAQGGAEDEYNLDLPGSGANEGTPTTSAGDVSDSSDSGGFPVIVVILVAGAGVAAGIAAWRLRKPHEPDEPA